MPGGSSMLAVLLLSQTALAASPADAVVLEARRKFTEINSRESTFKQDARMVSGVSAEGAEVTAFREGTAIRKLVLEALGETGKRRAEYYFDGGRLFFAFIQTIRYDSHIMETLSGKTLKEKVSGEDRLYFADGKLVRWLDFKKERSAKDSDWTERETGAQNDAANFVLLMTTAGAAGCNPWDCALEQAGRCTKYRCE